METYLIYIVKVAISTGVFYLAYLILFKNQKHFVFNRIYLPTSFLISFIIPLFTFTTVEYTNSVTESVSVPINTIIHATTPVVQPEIILSNEFRLEWFHYLFGLYVIGIICLVFYFLYAYKNALVIIRSSKENNHRGTKILVTQGDIHPFSFFNKIIIPQKIMKNSWLDVIVDHEKIHVQERHTLDIIFAEFLFILQWFNPFAWLLKNAIKSNLEYKTDHQVIKQFDEVQYQLIMVGLAHKKGIAPFLMALNGSQLKNRITMMKKKTENKYAFVKQMFVLPLLAVLIMGLSNKEVKTEYILSENSGNESSFSKVSENSDSLFYKNVSGKQIKNIIDSSIMSKIHHDGLLILEDYGEDAPLIILNDKIVIEKVIISEHDLKWLKVIKPKEGYDEYGKKGKNGVLIFNTEDKTDELLSTNEIKEKPELKYTGDFLDGTFKIKNSKGEFVKPLYLLNGEEKENLNDLERSNICNSSCLNDELATKYYGSKGENGVVQIVTKDWKFPKDSKPLIIIDGEEYSGRIKDIPQESLFHVRELRYPSEREEYGKKGKDGVVEISTNKEQIVLLHRKKPRKMPDGLLGASFGWKTDLNNLNVDYQDKTQDSKINIPSGFSPNGDGIHDVFEVYGLEKLFPNFKMKIYDSHKNSIWEYTHNGDPNTTPKWWNGKDKNNNIKKGTYYYEIEYNDDSKLKSSTGTVVLSL